jgi:hypothetical protein
LEHALSALDLYPGRTDPKFDHVTFRSLLATVLRLQAELNLRSEARATWARLEPMAGPQAGVILENHPWIAK